MVPEETGTPGQKRFGWIVLAVALLLFLILYFGYQGIKP
jgi:hypothetical protein